MLGHGSFGVPRDEVILRPDHVPGDERHQHQQHQHPLHHFGGVEEELDDVSRLYPSKHYVMIDDKLRILDTMKKIWGSRVTTVFPRQGHYATDPEILAKYPHGDIQLNRIADLVEHDFTDHVRQ